MYGDRLVVCDMINGRFFAGWKKQVKTFAEEAPVPRWSDTVEDAKKSRSLMYMQNIAKMLGNGMQVMSETKARNVEAMKWCKERQEYAQRVRGGK